MTAPFGVRFGLGAIAALVSTLSACSNGGGSASPVSPSPSTGSSLTGTWRGTASDSSGPGQITWQITQSGTTVTGTLTMTDTATNLTGRGSVSGTVSGSSVTFTMTIPAGGFDAPYASCSAQVSGEAQLASSTLSGSYSGSNSCAGAIASGQLTLDKQ